MPWGRWDDQLYDNGKVASFSDKAYRLWGNSISYANRHRTGGRLTMAQVNVLAKPIRATQRTVDELVEKRGWERADGVFIIHDFLEFNDTPETISARAEARAAAGRIGGKRSGETRRSKSEANASSVASEANEANANPVTRTNPVTQIDSVSEPRLVHTDIQPRERELRQALAPVPKVPPVLASKHQAIYQALVERCGQPANDAERGKVGRAAKLLTQAGSTSHEVFELADALEARWPEAECTPLAIANNVSTLRGPVKSNGRSGGLGARLSITQRAVAELKAEGR